MPASGPNPIILYDGVCGLCNRLVQFLLKHDSHDSFRFASLQSNFAAEILRRHNASPDDLDTMFVVLNYALPDERIASRSDAAVVALRELGGGWSALGAALQLLPLWLRNWGYNRVARNRYRVFGKYDSCAIPSEKDRRKFLDLQ
ncbi:MAG TPA: DCC1-like thiol-disulfide oxidoreductase family protein [Terriglobales bacterium]|nr:DCC1-like thiol-disulfide oxidoreductase family protein [Terriglobales bacterium]